MAGDGHRDLVGTAGLSHAAHSFRLTDATCDLRVACRLPSRDLAQGLPNALLERRATDVERQVETDVRPLHKAHDLCDDFLEPLITSDEIGVWETVLKIARQRVGIVPEQDGADAFGG